MIECNDVDKKNNEKCKSPAKWNVKINDEKEYIYPRCGRHSRNMDKILIENTKEKKKRGRKPKLLENDENNELKFSVEEDKIEKSDIQEMTYPKNNNNKDEKIKILFTKINELCNLLNKKYKIED